MVFVPSSPEVEAGALPPKELVEEMNKLNAEMKKAGVLVDAAGLLPMAKSKRLKFAGPGKATVLDGPYSEAKELVAGYWLLEVKSVDEAIRWISKAPFGGGVELQVRPLHDVSDWPEELRKAAEL
jgi:hypothetical protein